MRRRQGLIYAFLFRLRLAVAALQSLILPHLSGLSLPALAFDPSTFEARLSFLRRGLKLLRTCQRWRRYMRALRVPVVPETVNDEGMAGGMLEVGAGATFDELVQRELVARTLLPVVEAAWASGGEAVARQVSRGPAPGVRVIRSPSCTADSRVFTWQIIDALPKDMPPALRRRLEGGNVGGV